MSSRLLTISAFGLVLSVALPALAQAPAPTERAFTDLLQTGIMGAICVILMGVIRVLDVRISTQQSIILDLTKQMVALMTEHAIVTKRQVDLLERSLSRREGADR